MEFQFGPLPNRRELRPVVTFTFPKLPQASVLGLIDSGAVGTRISADYADALDLDITNSEPIRFIAGGGSYDAFPATIPITVAGHTRDTRVHFVRGWPHSYALLGIEGFFENYIVRIDATKRLTQLRPSRH